MESRQVDRRGVRIVQVDPVDVVVLVAARVLQVQQPARIVGPLVAQHAAGLVRGHAPRLGAAVEVLDPDVEPVPPRRQVGDPGAVRRDRRARAIGWSKKVLNCDDVGYCHVVPFFLLVRSGETPVLFLGAWLRAHQSIIHTATVTTAQMRTVTAMRRLLLNMLLYRRFNRPKSLRPSFSTRT